MVTSGAFICKYDSTGQIKWLTPYDSNTSLHAFSIVINSANDLFVGGGFSDSLSIKLNNTTITEYYSANGCAYVLKLDSAGSVKWFKNYGNSDYPSTADMAIDTNDDLFFLTHNGFLSQLDLAPNVNAVYLIDSVQTTITKVDSAANFIWAQGYRAIGFFRGINISLNPFNQIAISGIMRGTCDFDLSSNSFNLTTNYNTGVESFILTLEPEGDFIWAGLLHNMEPEYNYSWGLKWINNALYVAGSIDDIVDFDPDSINSHLLVSNVFPFGADYLLRLNTCDPINTNIFVSTCDEYFWGQTNLAYTTSGVYSDTLVNSIGCDSTIHLNLTINETTESYDDIYTCDSYTWIDGNTYTYSNNTATITFTNAGGCDSIIHLNLTIMDSTVWYDEITACDAYTWIDGNTYFSSNNSATYTISNVAGCDSIIILHLDLTVNESTEGFDVISACDSYTWVDGNTYTSSNNSAIYTVTNSVGCDSIVHLNLTITESTEGFDEIIACDSYTWIDGNVYTNSNNTATYTSTNANNCDSIIHLNLTIHESTESYDEITSCNSYIWIDGNTYSSSNNTASYYLTNAVGCDSIVHLNLTINESTVGYDEITACDSYMWIDWNTYTSNNNTATFTSTNSAGCDSIIHLNLTINESTEGYDVITSCDSYTWIDGNTYINSTNTATYILTNSAGCDSIVHLNLNINESTEWYDEITACYSYTWIDGNTYTSSNNIATYILNNAIGCDSIIHLNLTIMDSTVWYDEIIACDSYIWIDGNTYTNSNNMATYTLTSVAGCDSVIHLNLIIIESTVGFDEISACDSYTWIDGNTYTSSNNTATYILTNAAGCDSLISLNLNIYDSYEFNLVDSACDEYWLNNIAYYVSGYYSQSLSSMDGCDSIVNLDLTLSFIPDPVIEIENGNSLVTEFFQNSSYQWIDCASLSPSPNETSNIFTPIVSGDYAVIVSNECGTDTSDCLIFNGVHELIDSDILIYPNPTSNYLFIQVPNSLMNTEYFVYNELSELVHSSKIISNEETIDTRKWQAGTYFIHFSGVKLRSILIY